MIQKIIKKIDIMSPNCKKKTLYLTLTLILTQTLTPTLTLILKNYKKIFLNKLLVFDHRLLSVQRENVTLYANLHPSESHCRLDFQVFTLNLRLSDWKRNHFRRIGAAEPKWEPECKPGFESSIFLQRVFRIFQSHE